MILSSRQVRPTMALRRTQSSTQTATVSSTSSVVPSSIPTISEFSKKYGYHHLLNPPLPSPALPSNVPRHGKRPTSNHLRNSVRYFLGLCLWICGVGLLYWVTSTILGSAKVLVPAAVGHLSLVGEAYDLVGDTMIPLEATPMIVTDNRGKSRWTVSIPGTLDFPLRPSDYAKICSQSDAIIDHLLGAKSQSGSRRHGERSHYDHVHSNFMDVVEAEEHGLLSPAMKNKAGGREIVDRLRKEKPVGADQKLSQNGGSICERSLTYVMEGDDAGLGKTLMGLWMSYGLAMEEDRAFFIDDTNWAYGEYTTFFEPPPIPSCLPPPPTHRLPCPHQARHLVVSPSTTPWTFGRAFHEKYQNTPKLDPLHQKPIFSLLRTGHDALFRLAPSGASYVSTRTSELDSLVHSRSGLTVGLHIRHGDRHPWEFQYQKSYIPSANYLNAAHDLIASNFHPENTTTTTTPLSISEAESASRIILASDDPDIYESPDFSLALRAQSQIRLASKATLDATTPDPPTQNNGFKAFIEGNVGWEGGFFPNVFWGLGNPSADSATAEGLREGRAKPSEMTLGLRQLVARAYVLDMKIVGGADRVVCAVSSVGCRLLAVMVGWEEGIENGKWRNVDGGFGWVAFDP